MHNHNYLVKADPGIRDMLARIAATEPADALFVLDAWERAQAAPKFVMPEGGRLLQDHFRGLPDDFRLPYPEIVLEYSTSRTSSATISGAPGVAAPERIVYAREFSRAELLAVTSGPDTLTLPAGVEHFIQVMSFCSIDLPELGPHWVPGYSMALVEGRRGDSTDPGITIGPGQHVVPGLKMRVVQLFNTHYRSISHEAAYSDILDECCAVLELIEALSCSNVKTEVNPASPKVNAKRRREGKRPLPDYHVLMVEVPQTTSTSERQGGHHASPRQHLRRGHIRRIHQATPNERRIWINSAIVGDPTRGKLAKDYALHTK